MLVKFIITFGGFTFLLQKKKFQYNYKDGNFVTMDRKFDGSFRKGLQVIERSFKKCDSILIFFLENQ